MKKLEETVSDHVLATFTHGLLFGIHTLGVIYNYQRGKKRDVLIHGGIAIYDLIASYNHYKKSKRAKELINRRYESKNTELNS